MSSSRWVVLASILVVLGCGTETGLVATDNVIADIQPMADASLDTSQPEDSILETFVEETSIDDLLPMDQTDDNVGPQPACAPGEGCFLDECQKNTDCLSGWCVEHMGQKVCTLTCQEECPQGWTCSQVGASDPDVVFICVSDFTSLCRPCNAALDCTGVAGTEDACVTYGEQGSFCGGGCGEGMECPWGFACQSVTTVDGIELDQCVAETGLCPCTDTAVELGLFTNCQASNDFGTCAGKRVCTEEGLSDCDAPKPSAEVCNAIDDNCNSLIDEVDLEDGTPVCDDENACTLDTCNGEAGCEHEDLSEGECLDGDACTIGDHCEAGTCLGQPINCDDGDVCTDDLCDGLGGCTTEHNTADCDDEDPCTVNDTCNEGVCGGYAVDCECSVDADCLALEDDTVCNGTLACDTTKLPYLCQVDPATVIECPDPEPGPDAICQQPSCNPETGECSLVADHGGFACEDGSLCTIGDKCVEGVCTPGVSPNCNDGNGCTDDTCEPDSGCLQTDNTEACEDGNVCTTDDTCAAGECVAGGPLMCDDNNVCNGQESCNPATGCQTGQPLLCDDSDACNGLEACDPLVGCENGEPLVCDDGNVCNGQETCASGLGCQTGEPLVCEDDDEVCTDTYCEPDAGCVTVLNQALCDDDDLCTTGDHCELGECISSGALTCNDLNECTDDSCNPVSGCVFTHNDAICDDGSVCTTSDICSDGKCTGIDTSAADCDDNNDCTDDTCNPLTGCASTNNTAICDDGIACTINDICKDGICLPGNPVECDDGQYCNGMEVCDPAEGCLAGAPPVLDDEVDCTVDTCDEESDTVAHTAQDAACDDDQFCNGIETCDVLQGCQPGSAPSVDDEVDCTEDTCDEATDQALHTPLNADCDDDLFCNGTETCDVDDGCQNGNPPLLDDDNACTADSCDEDTDSVIHTPIISKEYTFGVCGQTGYTGPSQSQCNNAYAGTSLAGQVSLSAGIQVWTVPHSGLYDIEAIGAGGSRGKQHNTNVYTNGVPGKGARMSGRFQLNQGDVLHIIVGQKGSEKLSSSQKGGGGGGGSFVVRADDTPLLVAGGGGGSGRYDGNNGDDGVTGQNGTSGNGNNGAAGGTNGQGGAVSGCSYAGDSGAGLSGNGKSTCGKSYFAKSYTNGGQGGDWSHCWNDGNSGGFGGGGGTGPHGGGGGGGYSGGGGGGDINCGGNGGGGGAGSYNAGQNQDNQAGHESGQGSVTIEIGCN